MLFVAHVALCSQVLMTGRAGQSVGAHHHEQIEHMSSETNMNNVSAYSSN